MTLLLVATGVAMGVLSGLLGIGGGVVVVPVLLELYAAQGLPAEARTALAVGTAHAAVLLASVPAAWAHGRARRMDRALLRAWLPPMLAGAAAGLAVGQVAPPGLVSASFALVAAGLGLSLLLPPRPAVPRGPGGALPPAATGLLAAALGVGGGTIGGPLLALRGVALHQAAAAGAAFNVVVALPAAAVSAALGQVSGTALLALTLPALGAAPLAARLAPHVPARRLRLLSALCLLGIAARVAASLLP